jgi:hypothetical protein
MDAVWLVRELWPGSDVEDNLKQLLCDALRTPAHLDECEVDRRTQQNVLGPDRNRAYESLRELQSRIRDKEFIVGSLRVARILRDPIPPPQIYGSANQPELVLQPARTWVNCLIKYLNDELRELNDKRMLMMTVCAAIAAVVAAFLSLTSVLLTFLSIIQGC